MKLADLNETQKDNLFATYYTEKICLFCKQAFGSVFVGSYTTEKDLEKDLNLFDITEVTIIGAK